MSKPLSQHFTISSAIITSDYKTGNVSIDNLDVSGIVTELMITESIARPYTHGKILLVDQNNILRRYRFRGTERITITLSPAKENGVDPITRTYIMMGRDATVNNDTFVFSLIEESGYLASTKIVGQAYTDTLPNILINIIKGKMSKDLKAVHQADADYLDVVKQKTHVVVPQMTTWEAVNWIANRMSTASGTPYFICSSLYKNAPMIWSLEKALDSTPFNERPFMFSDIYAKNVGSVEVEGTMYAETGILGYTERYNDSLHVLEKACALAGIYDIVDTNTNTASPVEYNLGSTLKGLVEQGIISRQQVMDDYFTINDQNIAYTPSASLMQATSGGTYLKGDSYNDDMDEATTRTKLANKMLHNVMINHGISADLPGKLFAASGASVGNKIRMHFDNGNKRENGKPQLDIKLSGDYIITQLTHHFGDLQYNVTVEGVKFHDDESERKV